MEGSPSPSPLGVRRVRVLSRSPTKVQAVRAKFSCERKHELEDGHHRSRLLGGQLPSPEDAPELPSLHTCRRHKYHIPSCSELASSEGDGSLDSKSRNHLSQPSFPTY